MHDITVAAYCALGLAESPTLTLKSALDSFVGENPGPMLSADQIGRMDGRADGETIGRIRCRATGSRKFRDVHVGVVHAHRL